MNEVRIVTNNVPRPILYGWELTEKEKENFDYYTEEELDCATFFRYKGEAYDIADFMRANFPNSPFSSWAGYSSDSFFSGIVIKFPPDSDDHVIVGWYCS